MRLLFLFGGSFLRPRSSPRRLEGFSETTSEIKADELVFDEAAT
jgi:hypothetical protein